MKYNNKKTIVDHIRFDSKKEAKRYEVLREMQKAKVISGLTLQPRYYLQEKFKKNGVTFRAITYKADFEYIENGEMVVEDVKGMQTEVFKIKRKMFEYNYPELTLLIT